MGRWLRSSGSKKGALLCKTLWSWKLSGETSYFIPFLVIVVLASIPEVLLGRPLLTSPCVQTCVQAARHPCNVLNQ